MLKNTLFALLGAIITLSVIRISGCGRNATNDHNTDQEDPSLGATATTCGVCNDRNRYKVDKVADTWEISSDSMIYYADRFAATYPMVKPMFVSKRVFDNIFNYQANNGVICRMGLDDANRLMILIAAANGDSTRLSAPTASAPTGIFRGKTFCPPQCPIISQPHDPQTPIDSPHK